MNSTLSQSRLSGILIPLAAAVVIFAGIKAASPVLGPLVFSVFLTLIFGMLLHWFEKKGLSTRLALILTLTIFFSIVVVFLLVIAESFIQFLSELPGYLQELEGSLELASPYLISAGIDPARSPIQYAIRSTMRLRPFHPVRP